MSLQERRWNIEQCNRCHRCKMNPTVQSKAFAPMCPSIEYGQFHACSGSGMRNHYDPLNLSDPLVNPAETLPIAGPYAGTTA